MKRCLLCLLILVLVCTLFGCSFLLPLDFMDMPQLQEVQIEGITYRTGFYQGCHLTQDVTSVEAHGNTDAGYEYSVVDGTPFDLIWALEYGFYGMGAIYCRQDQFDAAAAYYDDPDNYDYKLFEGNPADLDEDPEYPMPGLDMEKYWALMEFENAFNQGTAPSKEAVLYNVPLKNGERYAGEYYFQEISNDGNFVKNYGRRYRVADGKLVMVASYGVKNGTVEVVDVPKELSDYFLQFFGT